MQSPVFPPLSREKYPYGWIPKSESVPQGHPPRGHFTGLREEQGGVIFRLFADNK
jgi:hypothetical protein